MSGKGAFSVQRLEHKASDESTTIEYDKVYCESEAWDGKSTYCVPKDGLYFFTVAFMRDSQMGDDGNQGTSNDTQVYLCVEGKMVAFAWAGESSRTRQTASVSVILPLEKGKKVTTMDWTEKNEFRRYWNVVFSGYRVGKLK
jgi:hypothetical protein